MSIYNRRNALVGFVAIKMIQRRLRRRKRAVRKAVVFGGLGLLSVGALVGVGAVLVKRQRGEARHLEGYAEGEEAESAIVGETDRASSAPIPAT